MKREEAERIANELVSQLETHCFRIAIAGSIRRRKMEVGDVELLCIPKIENGYDLIDLKIRNLIQANILDYRRNKLGSIIYGEKNKLLVHVKSGFPIDIFSTNHQNWWVSLVVRTGPKESNMRIAIAAQRKGWKFRSYEDGFDTPNGRIVCSSEREVFELVGLKYKSPEERR